MRLELQDPGEPYEVTAVVFSSDGQAEAHVEYQNVDRFELGPLTPGKKGVVVYSRRGDLAPVSAVVVMGDTEDTELVLGPGRAVPVEGVVVNAQGRGVPGVDVEFSVLLPVGLSFLPRKNHSFGGLFGGESHTGGGTRIRHRKFSVIPAGNAIRLTQSGDTDDQGHFSLPLYSRDDGVTLRLKKGTELLKEETVLPSRSPLRLIVPGADDPSK